MHKDGPAYSLPHLLNRDSGGQPFEDVLIVGPARATTCAAASGTGPGTSTRSRSTRASSGSARTTIPTAVRRPAGLGPSRRWPQLRQARPARSTTWRPTRWSIRWCSIRAIPACRLESFLFTEEAFRDIKAKLKPGGVFVMYNYFRQGWVVGRLAELAEKVFGTPADRSLAAPSWTRSRRTTTRGEGSPACSSACPGRRCRAGPQGLRRRRLVLAGTRCPRRTRGQRVRWPGLRGSDGYDGSLVVEVRPVRVVTSGVRPLPTDDWPFLYLRAPVIPALNLRGWRIVAASRW